MNKVELVGRLVRDPEVKTTKNQIEVCSFTLAVDRRRKNAAGEKMTDFLTCVAWRKTASILGKYCQKGSRIAVIGQIETRSYEPAEIGRKAYVTEIIVDEIELLDAKKAAGTSEAVPDPMEPDEDYPEIDDDTTLPFDMEG
jgi:single-strand DNA-binding protein